MTMNKTVNLFKNIAKVLAPPPKLTVSDWADSYRVLSSESSAEAGPWNTARAEYQREIMNAVNDPTVENVSIMSSAQVGKSEILLNIIGYYVAYDPAPIMLVLPTKETINEFSNDRIAPMIRDTPALSDKFGDPKTRNSGNTLTHKKFPGGYISIAGANSPASLASKPIRILLADEVDRYPISSGTEGDPLRLAEKRTTTFWNRKKVKVSTPLIKGTSRIEREYMAGTQEKWNVKCPKCGKYLPYKWGNIRFEDVTMECEHCKERFDEHTWKRQPGKWIAQAPEVKGHRSFHLNELASPWKRWEEIIKDFKESKDDPELLKTWVNTSLGEPWEAPSDTDADHIIKRRERYDCEVPDPVLLLTCGVDVQDDRLELEVVGWGHGKESWGIDYQMFMGDTTQKAVWQQLDDYLQKEFISQDGQRMHIVATCIDSGGHRTTEVYRFCKSREHRRIFAIKGRGGEGIPFISKPRRNNRENAVLFTLGVDQGKANIISRLKVEFEGPGYCHFPIEKEKGYDEYYFDGITSESMKIRTSRGQRKVYWEKKSGVRNEPLDVRNYATAAMEIFNPNFTALEKQKEQGMTAEYVQTPRQQRRRRKVVSKGVM